MLDAAVAPRDCSNIVPSSRDYSPPILQYYDVYVKDNAVYYTNATNNGVVSDGRVAGLVFGFMQAWDLGTGTTVILTSSMQCSVTTPDGVVHPYTAGGPIVWSPQGINKYTCTVTDAAGNTATKTITVSGATTSHCRFHALLQTWPSYLHLQCEQPVLPTA